MNEVQLSATDRKILSALARDGRIPYKELANEVGLPVSTCHGRVRALEERGVIRGYRAEIDPEALGHSVTALILLRVHNHFREQVPELSQVLRRVPGVQQLFLIGGDRDLVVHVAVESIQALRDLLAEHFGTNPALAQTQTQIVFEHFPGLEPA